MQAFACRTMAVELSVISLVELVTIECTSACSWCGPSKHAEWSAAHNTVLCFNDLVMPVVAFNKWLFVVWFDDVYYCSGYRANAFSRYSIVLHVCSIRPHTISSWRKRLHSELAIISLNCKRGTPHTHCDQFMMFPRCTAILNKIQPRRSTEYPPNWIVAILV